MVCEWQAIATTYMYLVGVLDFVFIHLLQHSLGAEYMAPIARSTSALFLVWMGKTLWGGSP